jgi:hypothetical protein
LGFRELYKGLHIRPDNIEDSILTVRKRLYTLGLEREAVYLLQQNLKVIMKAKFMRYGIPPL